MTDQARPTGDHPLRYQLVNELHARPFPQVLPPTRIDHLAYLLGGEGGASAHAHLGSLCARHGIDPPRPDARHFTGQFGNFGLKWELHAEFVTWTYFRPGLGADPFAEPLSRAVPEDWLSATPGALLVHSQLAVYASADPPLPPPAEIARWFAPDSLCGSLIGQGAVMLWTDFRLHGDGASRLVVCGPEVDPRRVGRLVQRLLEIETYRILALLALPLAREIAPKVDRVEGDLASLIAAIGQVGDPDEDRQLLNRLTALAAALEELIARSSYRFGAAAAYYELVRTRLAILKEAPAQGHQTLAEFLDRRLAPAMRTCATMRTRLEDLHQRLARSANLLRTRVEIALEQQNRDLLHSMNRRAELQLRLQETVEGLSVVAISYYALGLLGHLLEPLLDSRAVHTVLGIGVPVVLGLAWIVTRRIRAKHRKAEKAVADAVNRAGG